jgi:hypothetical protein
MAIPDDFSVFQDFLVGGETRQNIVLPQSESQNAAWHSISGGVTSNYGL